MIARYADEHGGVFEPEDLALLHEVCVARGYAPDSEQAEFLALLIVTLFQSGFVDATSLRKALDDNRSQT
jgi:hypothetical protein